MYIFSFDGPAEGLAVLQKFGIFGSEILLPVDTLDMFNGALIVLIKSDCIILIPLSKSVIFLIRQ